MKTHIAKKEKILYSGGDVGFFIYNLFINCGEP